jgi:hypothetical protein
MDKTSVFSEIKPDVTVYKKGSRIQGLNFRRAEFFIEFKADETDPFRGNRVTDLDAVAAPETNAHPTDSELNIGQALTYAVSHLGSGFFTHVFSVLIFQNKARLFRWDRAGCIVSKSFNYVKTSYLIDFFRRYDNLTPEQRGQDTTVKTPSKTDRSKAAKALKPIRANGEADDDFNKRLAYFDPSEFVEYSVNDSRPGMEGRIRRLVGPPPSKPPLSLQGRASRGSPVWDVETGAICYLKDTWRIDSPDQVEEGKIYDQLHAHSVPHIAKAVVHGDVTYEKQYATNYHVTKTDKYCQSQESWCKLKQEIQGFIHYRIVLDMVGKDFTTFDSSKQLLKVTLDAMKGTCPHMAALHNRTCQLTTIYSPRSGVSKSRYTTS